MINSVDRDGTQGGYDLKLAESIHSEIDVPLTMLGGVGTIDHIRELIGAYPVIGAAAGSLFVFKGKYRAVLINYPSVIERDAILGIGNARLI